MTTTTRTAAQSLQHIIDHWDDLTASVDTSAPAPWPPARSSAEYLRHLDDQDAAEATAERSLAEAIAHALHHPQRLVTARHPSGQLYYQCAFCTHVGEGHTHPVREDRAAEQLATHPTPIRLHVSDAARAITLALCGLADQIAARDATDPNDWYQTPDNRTTPTAARWLLSRLGTTPCCPTHDTDCARITTYAHEAANRLDRVLGTGHTTTPLPLPCPWCTGTLWAHLEAGTITHVTCRTGLIDCTAPAAFDIDLRARIWSTDAQLAQLQKAIEAAERKRALVEQRARRTEARRQQRAAAKHRAVA
ncbi:hypothetical protein [Streptomyces sp. NPDC005953]|uniref:hypothetical protein n=1 Tax=Streptomyces sp. NPDC005953 TaxID=3156719 RepID=UPI0033F1B140